MWFSEQGQAWFKKKIPTLMKEKFETQHIAEKLLMAFGEGK